MDNADRIPKPPPYGRLTAFPFPPYSYVTGHTPHPLRDPHGHGCAGPAGTVLPGARCEMYLWGIDLFNGGYYWEAHEAWEAVWHAADRKGMAADFCKALIKLAAAGVKAREGREAGVTRHARRCAELTKGLLDSNGHEFWDLRLSDLLNITHKTVTEVKTITQLAVADHSLAVLPCLPWGPAL